MKYSSLTTMMIIIVLSSVLNDELKPKQVKTKKNDKQVYYQGHVGSHAHIVHSPLISHTHIQGHIIQPYSNIHTHVAHQDSYHHLHTFARSYVTLARLAYCPKHYILAKKCTICPQILKTYITFFIHSINQNKKRLFQFIILYSDIKKEVIITFSGPKTTQASFFNKVYKKGFKKISELGNVKIEKFFWDIYSKYMRKVLIKNVKKVIKSKRGGYKFIFVGHSFGGSFATLAAYDLVQNKIVVSDKKISSPIVYTYGSIRIGDNDFVNKVNSLFKVIRIVRNDDYVTRVPSCVYDASFHLFRCYRRVSKVVKTYPAFRRYFLVYRRGLKVYRRSIISRVANSKVRAHSHYHSYYSQPLGTLIYYTGNNFTIYNVCKFESGIPVCEKNIKLPNTFSPSVHALYYSENVELC